MSGGGEPLPEDDEEIELPPIEVAGGVTPQNKRIESRLSRMLPDYYVAKLRAKATEHAAALAALTNQAQAEAYIATLPAKVATVFGPLPARPALNGNVTGTLIRTGYKVEKLTFDSLAGWRVSANLYVPDSATAEAPKPGILVLCGHDTRAKWAYQSYAQGLCKLGYVVLIMDPVGAGERLQHPSTQPVVEHRTMGRQMPIAGWSMAGLQAFDASRGIDYLVSRAEVDDTHIGVSGTSGGGTQAVWVAAIDSRVTMVAPSCFVTTFLRNLENELWADHEQVPVRCLAEGLDIDDFLLARAPAPVKLIGQALDFFDLRGFQEIATRLSDVYTLLGAAGAAQSFVDTNDHQMDADGFRAAAQLFSDVTGIPGGTVVWPSTTNEPAVSDLWATPDGDVNQLSGAVTSVGLLTGYADAAAVTRGTPTGATLISRVEEVLAMPSISRATPPEYRIWEVYRQWSHNGVGISPAITPPNYPKSDACVFAVETEPGILVPTYYLASAAHHAPVPTVAAGTAAIVYVAHLSADQELSQPGRESLITTTIAANPNTAFFAVDVRGTGESQPITNGVFGALTSNAGSGDDLFAEIAEALDEPLLGRCVWDVLRVCDLLASHGYTQIHLMGRGWGAIPAALAGLLHSNVTAVTLKNTLTRWHACAIAKPAEMAWPHSRLPRGVLAKFDLPDVYAELAASKTFAKSDDWGAWLANPAGEF